jgi:hypothetical protein
MSLFKAPKAPDPMKTAQAQGAANTQTAISQALLNQVDQQTPWGSLDYSQTGTASFRDPVTGKMTSIPQFSLKTTLNPADQALLDQERAFDSQGNTLAINQLGRVAGALSEPVNLSNDAIEGRLMELGRKRLDPVFAERQSSLENTLANKGLQPGSAAYDREYRKLGEQENDAYNQLMLGGRAQSINEILTARNQPLQEASALMSGGAVAQPVFQNTPQSGIAGTDVAGLINSNYQNKLSSYNAAMGGLAGIGAAGIGGWAQNGFALSDRRLKTNIKKVGSLDDGTKIYSYRMKGGGLAQLGVMAQEVEKKHPGVVATTPSGFKAVNYAELAEKAA